MLVDKTYTGLSLGLLVSLLAFSSSAYAQDDATVMPAAEEAGAVEDAKEEVTETVTESGDYSLLRMTLKTGAYIPRGSLGVGATGLLELDVVLPLYAWLDTSDPWIADRFRFVAEVGYTRITREEDEIVQGRGLTEVRQVTDLLPVRLGFLYVAPEAWKVRPYGGIAYGMFFSWTDFGLFNQDVSENDFASGVVLTAGMEVSMPMAGLDTTLVIESNYSEAKADLGTLGDAGEPVISGANILVGFGIDI